MEPLSLDDIASVKSYLKRTNHSNSTGIDLATYDLLIDIDNNHLLPLFQRAIEHRDIPSSWLTSTIIALAKPGKDFNQNFQLPRHRPRELRAQICLTAGPPQIMSGPPTVNTIPPSQNGFSRGVSHQ
ncbi:hypothetical protein LENED_009437 [Lentinula edodes]|uniref:Uncharacterized protein n=1 Tax=Lentinula edodes TaxID=5353 RepID=A0A1Q3EJP4_LENED|nr:hypothetical protein LENED_009437 [Lentinula edodes]